MTPIQNEQITEVAQENYMNPFSPSTRHEVITAHLKKYRITKAKLAGLAFQPEGKNYFELKLWMLPLVTYYVSPNINDTMHYTVFSSCEIKDGIEHFKNPVGRARLSDQLKTQLKIDLNMFPHVNLFLSLFPH